MNNTNNKEQIRPFKWFYCQKVLPAVFDDSLSYVELLYKFLSKLNEVITTLNDEISNQEELIQKIEDAKSELEALINKVKSELEAADNNLQGQITTNLNQENTHYYELKSLYSVLRNLYNELQNEISHLIANMKVYDPTKGKFTNSIDANRRIMQVLATPADEVINCDAVGKLTVNALNIYKCGELVNASFKRNKEIPYQNTTIETDVNIYKLTKYKLTTAKLAEAPEFISEVSM